MFADLELGKRLEKAEGFACAQHARARARLLPESGAEVLHLGDAFAAFDGIDSPTTQCFGLGVLHALDEASLEEVERFYSERRSATDLEVSPLSGVPALRLLCERGYRPIEASNVLYRDVHVPVGEPAQAVRARPIRSDEVRLWCELCADGWAIDLPNVRDLLLELGEVMAERRGSTLFIAECEGKPGAAGALSICEGVALFAGSATVPDARRRGLHGALLRERMRFAAEQGCDLAMMVAQPGSGSQKNAERHGFRIAYTRLKWRRECR